MADRLVLHIGAMKTGTSFLQSVFNTNVEALEADGVRFLGGKFGVQSRAVRDVLDLPKQPEANRRKWRKLIRELRKSPAETGVVSMEFLSFAGPRHLAAFFEPLDGIEVDVVLTVRDMFRVIPAQWQTYTRNFGTDGWADYQRHVVPRRLGRDRSRAHQTFHRAQNLQAILDVWRTAVPDDRIHLVTVPGPDAPRDLLWHRFTEAADLPSTVVDLAGTRDNASIGYGSCDFMRRLNEHLSDVRPKIYRSATRPLIQEALVPLRGSETKPGLNEATAQFARKRNDDVRRLLTSGPHPWVGALEDLPLPTDLSAFPKASAAPTDDEVRAASTAFWGRVATEPAPTGLSVEDLVARTADAVRRAHGWD